MAADATALLSTTPSASPRPLAGRPGADNPPSSGKFLQVHVFDRFCFCLNGTRPGPWAAGLETSPGPAHQAAAARRGPCPLPLTVQGRQALVSFAPLARTLVFAARPFTTRRNAPLGPRVPMSTFSKPPVPRTVDGTGPPHHGRPGAVTKKSRAATATEEHILLVPGTHCARNAGKELVPY